MLLFVLMYIFSKSQCAWFKTKTFSVYESKVVLVDWNWSFSIHSHNMLLHWNRDFDFLPLLLINQNLTTKIDNRQQQK